MTVETPARRDRVRAPAGGAVVRFEAEDGLIRDIRALVMPPGV